MQYQPGMGAITYDWTQCPPDLPPAQEPAYYGPLASDVGPRSEGEYEPYPDVEMESCPSGFNMGLGENSGLVLIGGIALLVFLFRRK